MIDELRPRYLFGTHMRAKQMASAELFARVRVKQCLGMTIAELSIYQIHFVRSLAIYLILSLGRQIRYSPRRRRWNIFLSQIARTAELAENWQNRRMLVYKMAVISLIHYTANSQIHEVLVTNTRHTFKLASQKLSTAS